MAGLKETIDTLRGDRSALAAEQRPLFVAKRRRNWIFWLKIALPAVAVVTVGYLVISSRQQRGTIIDPTVLTDVAKINAGMSVNNVKYDGVDSNNQPFSITAATASQPQGNDDVIDLTQPQADITMADGAWVALTAANGVYRRKEDLLDLSGDVTVFHDTGMSFQTDAATIDLKAHTAKGDQPVEGQRPDGEIASDGFEVLDEGKTVIFTGRAYMKIFAKNGKDKNG